jgi:hypothetical protein
VHSLKVQPGNSPFLHSKKGTEHRPFLFSAKFENQISQVHKLFTKRERFWNAVVSFRERKVRIVVSTGRQKLPGNIIFKKAEIW